MRKYRTIIALAFVVVGAVALLPTDLLAAKMMLSTETMPVKAGISTNEGQHSSLKLDEFRNKVKKKYESGIPEPNMVAVPANSFRMGCDLEQGCDEDAKPVHVVSLDAFEMSATEITFEQYDACFAFGGCDHYPDDEGWGRGDRPVINVSWDDAQQYIVWLNGQTDKNYRLPTEAEWEYAAQAESSTQYSWGNEVGINKANCDGCGCQWDNQQTAPVGSFQANSFGLYDMHGNVWEWCGDWYDKDYYKKSSVTNPQGPPSGSCRVIRGGSWNSYRGYMRASNRSRDSLGDRSDNLGFRLVLPTVQ